MTTILIKKKDTSGAPAPGDLTNAAGGAEIAVNTADKRLYTKNSGGTVVEVGTNPATFQINSAYTFPTSDGTANQVLRTNGSGTLSFATIASGTVTSVDVSGGTTGLTTSGGPITSSGTITLAGVLAAANGGTGVNNSTRTITISGNAGTFNFTAASKTLGISNSITLAGTDATTMTFPGTSQTVAGLAVSNQVFTTAQTFRAANAVRSEAASTQDAVVIAGRAGGTSSYAVTLTPATLSSSTTLTLPNVTDTVAVIGTAQTFTAAQTFRAANAIRSEAASTQDAIVIAGRAGGSNSYAITLTPATLAASRTLTLPEPGSNETLGYINTPINSQSAAYTLVLTDAGKTILHPISDNNARTFTIPANSSVVYPVGTVITFVNLINTVTIAITTDTMYLAGDGTTGSRTLAAYGVASAVKVASTTWIISGNGLT